MPALTYLESNHRDNQPGRKRASLSQRERRKEVVMLEMRRGKGWNYPLFHLMGHCGGLLTSQVNPLNQFESEGRKRWQRKPRDIKPVLFFLPKWLTFNIYFLLCSSCFQSDLKFFSIYYYYCIYMCSCLKCVHA